MVVVRASVKKTNGHRSVRLHWCSSSPGRYRNEQGIRTAPVMEQGPEIPGRLVATVSIIVLGDPAPFCCSKNTLIFNSLRNLLRIWETQSNQQPKGPAVFGSLVHEVIAPPSELPVVLPLGVVGSP